MVVLHFGLYLLKLGNFLSGSSSHTARPSECWGVTLIPDARGPYRDALSSATASAGLAFRSDSWILNIAADLWSSMATSEAASKGVTPTGRSSP